MDTVSDILAHLDFAGLLYFTTEFSGDWGVQVPRYQNVIRFHLVLRGSCHVRLRDSGATHALSQGDFFMIPHGAAHDLLARPDLPAPPLETVLRDTGYTGRGPLVIRGADRGEPVRLLCGHFAFAPHARGNAFLRGLPDHIVARDMPDITANWINATVDLLALEADNASPGYKLVIHRMTEILFVQALRFWIADAEMPPGILRALADPQLARALAAIHDRPEEDWTVASLAREAGLSRSAFADRFRQCAQLSPRRYLTEWRLQKAHRMLVREHRTPEEVAEAVGYRSVSAFARVYASWFGEGPGQTRRRTSAGSLPDGEANPPDGAA